MLHHLTAFNATGTLGIQSLGRPWQFDKKGKIERGSATPPIGTSVTSERLRLLREPKFLLAIAVGIYLIIASALVILCLATAATFGRVARHVSTILD